MSSKRFKRGRRDKNFELIFAFVIRNRRFVFQHPHNGKGCSEQFDFFADSLLLPKDPLLDFIT